MSTYALVLGIGLIALVVVALLSSGHFSGRADGNGCSLVACAILMLLLLASVVRLLEVGGL